MKKQTKQTNFGCIVPLAIAAVSIVLASLVHIAFLLGIAVAAVAFLLISSIESRRDAALRKQLLVEAFRDFPHNAPEVIERWGQGGLYVELHFDSKELAHESVRSGAVTAYANRLNEVGSCELSGIETRYPGWNEERWMHLPPDNPILEMNNGDGGSATEPDRNPFLRLAKVLSLFVIIGMGVTFSLLQDSSLSSKFITLGVIIIVALIAWCYLEFRDVITRHKETTGLLRWKLAWIAVHPAMIPIYTIALPVIGILVHAWWRNSNP